MKKSRTSKHILRYGAWGIALGLGLGTQAALVTQTNNNTTANGGESWLTESDWDGPVNTPDNDYINNTSGFVTRTPPNAAESSPTFLGDSLTITNGATLKIKHTGVCTIPNLYMAAGGVFANGGVGAGSSMAGNLLIKGAGSFTFSTENNSNRDQLIDMLVTVDPTVDTISLINSNVDPIGSGWEFRNAANVFSGTWVVESGYWKGSGFGTGSFTVEDGGVLDLDAEYDNPAASLTIYEGGLFLLDQNVTVDTAIINFVTLSAKAWTANELMAHPTIGSAIDPTSSGTLTVLSGPPPIPTETQFQTADMLPGDGWNEASFWDNSAEPSIDFLYANNTDGWITQTPLSSSTFGGYALTIENGAILNLQDAADYNVERLRLGAGSRVTKSATGAASLDGTLDLIGTGSITFSALITNAMTTIESYLTTTNGSISEIVIDMEDTSESNNVQIAQSGFDFVQKSDFSGLWKVEAGMLKGSGFGEGSFLVTDNGRIDFDSTFNNMASDLTLEAAPTTNTYGGSMILDTTVTVGSATIWGVSLTNGLYTGAELKAHPVYGGAWAGDKTADTAVLAVGVAPPVTQILSHNSSTTWDTPTSWDNGLAPINIYDYVNNTPNRPTRNPNISGAVFPGRSLTISNGAQLKLQHNQSVTISNLTMYAGTQIRTVNNTTLNGDLALVGTGGIVCDFEKTTRSLTVNSLVTAADTITNITITASQADVIGNVSGFIFTNPTNTFSGTWIVEEGYLKGAGLGQGSFLIKENGFLELADEYINTNAFLTVEVSTNAAGQILLAQDMTVNKATLWGVELEAGTYGINELATHPVYGGVFALGSSGSITVSFVPVIPEIGDLTYDFTDTDVIIGWAEGSKYATYTLQSDNNLVNAPDWVDVVEIPGVDGPMSVTNMISTDPKLFYRVIGN